MHTCTHGKATGSPIHIVPFQPRFRTMAAYRIHWLLLTLCLAGVMPALAGAQSGPPPGGGDRGGPSGGFDPREMFQRMDANGNDQIDPEEMQGRARYFIERMANESGLDMSQPIPVDRLVDIMRSRMQQGGWGDRRGDDDDRDRDYDRRRDDADGDGRNRDDDDDDDDRRAPPPLVMGFGVPAAEVQTLGFGVAEQDALAPLRGRYDGRILERIEESLQRYDRNGDGVLETAEWEGMRWSTNPRDADKNRDGRLTRQEIADRYAQRYGNSLAPQPSSSTRAAPASSSSGSSSSGSSSSGSSSGGSSGGSRSGGGGSSPGGSGSGGSGGIDPRFVQYAQGLIKQNDANGNGVLEREEWSKLRDPEESDRNKDGKITVDELAQRLANYGKGGNSSSGRSASGSSARDAAGGGSSRSGDSGGRRSYRFTPAVERLPDDLPSWFARNDANADGQVSMSEYSTTWSDAKAKEFETLDVNGDGLISPSEALAGDD